MITGREKDNEPLYITFKQRKYEEYSYILTYSLTGKIEVVKYEHPKEIIIAIPISMKKIIKRYSNRKEFFKYIDDVIDDYYKELGLCKRLERY